MKTIVNTIACLSVALLALTNASAGPSGSARELPFRGSVDQAETQDIAFPWMDVEGVGSGTATHLGRYTESFLHLVDLTTGIGIGEAKFTAANGDTIETALTGLGLPIDANGSFRVVEEHTIIGGTGRFEKATGTFTLVRIINMQLHSVGSFEGTISLN